MDDMGMGTFWFMQTMGEAGDNARLRQENQVLRAAVGADRLAQLQQEGLVAPPAAVRGGDGHACASLFGAFMIALVIWLVVMFIRGKGRRQ